MPPLPQCLDKEKRSASALIEKIPEHLAPQGYYAKGGKRVLDLVSSAIGLFVLLPLFALVAFCIKVSSGGPVFYRQIRVGRNGRDFQIVKFRSMDNDKSGTHVGITVSGNKRVTRVGKILRHYKIDELPQLWNVLRGEMSIVGPRPELLKYVKSYSARQRLVLSVRPGITDPASLAYRHEEEILAGKEDPEQFYREQILPDKLERNLTYIRGISFPKDLQIIFATLRSSFSFLETRLL